jgi:predicted AlkP superfamily phosphohydrolase/phosphomutase
VRSRLDPRFRGALDEPIDPETRLRPKEVSSRIGEALDGQFPCRYRASWPAMKAFALPTFSDGMVRLNVRGRERDGVVAPDDVDAVLDKLEAELLRCDNPRTGAPAVSELVRCRPGDPSTYADLVVRWAGPTDALLHPDLGLIGPFPLHRTGTHSPNGFALITGPGVPIADLGQRSVLDLPPTILELLGRHGRPELPGQSLFASDPQLDRA